RRSPHGRRRSPYERVPGLHLKPRFLSDLRSLLSFSLCLMVRSAAHQTTWGSGSSSFRRGYSITSSFFFGVTAAPPLLARGKFTPKESAWKTTKSVCTGYWIESEAEISVRPPL